MTTNVDSDEKSNVDSDENDEKIINWEDEARAIINDVKAHVSAIEIAKALPCSESMIYLNIRTIEGEDYCVLVSGAGFRVVGRAYDTIEQSENEQTSEEDNSEDPDAEEPEVFETPYALLDKISPSYVQSFGNQLCKQLLSLQQMRTQFNEEDEEGLEEQRKEVEDEKAKGDTKNLPESIFQHNGVEGEKVTGKIVGKK